LKKYIPVTLLLLIASVLAGCSRAPITAESDGVWNHYFIYPFSQLIQFVAHFFNDNYGLAIILLTIVIRFIMLPLTLKQSKNQEKMKELQPELKKLRETYPSKDRESQMKLQKEMMDLYSKHNVNPLSMGCLPLLIQMPILLAFYYAIIKTKEIALHNFLWFNLGAADPLHLLPVLAAVTTFIQYKISTQQLTEANPQMKMMGYIMPAIILFSAWKLSAVLPLYWIVGNVFLTLQTLVLKNRKKKAATA
jgi:YidC/Oxa1 family membrane protein insertase